MSIVAILIAIRVGIYLIGILFRGDSKLSANGSAQVRRLFLMVIPRSALVFVGGAVQVRAWGFGTALICFALLPGVFVEWVLVPLGVPILPYWITRIMRVRAIGPENMAAAVFNELRARGRRGWLLDRTRVEALGRKLTDGSSGPTTRGLTVAAHGLQSLALGDETRARALFYLATFMPESARRARHFAEIWLLADAARRADYTELLRLSEFTRDTFRRHFMRTCAEQLLHPGTHEWLALRFLQWVSLSRANREFPRLALAARARPVRTVNGLANARNELIRLARLPPGQAPRAEILDAAVGWQKACDEGELRLWLRARAEALGVADDETGLSARIEREVTSLLSETWLRARHEVIPLPLPSLLEDAVDATRFAELERLENMVAELNQGDQPATGSIADHAARWAEVRLALDRFTESLPWNRAELYEAVGDNLFNHASWLHNRMNAFAIASDIFSRLVPLMPAGHLDEAGLHGNVKVAQRSTESV